MAKRGRPSKEESEVLESIDLNQAELTSNMLEEPAVQEDSPMEVRPQMGDLEWQDYVMKHFDETELWNGYPTVDGLARVVVKLLGPILDSHSHGIQSPTYLLKPDGNFLITPSVVEHHIKIGWVMDGFDGQSLSGHIVRHFTGVAEVNFMNTTAEFLKHGMAVCSTKAEGRALRKALMLKKPCAEEMRDAPVHEPEKPKVAVADNASSDDVFADVTGDENKKIDASQKNFIKLFMERTGIDLPKYLEVWTFTQEDFDKNQISFDKAAEMIKHLSDLQREPSRIPEGVKKNASK